MSGLQVHELRPGIFRVEELDGERRLCEHVVVGEEAVLVVDAGLPPTPAAGLGELVQRVRGDRERVVLVITHPDADHRGGAAPLAHLVAGLEVWAHALDAPQLRDPARTLADRYRAFVASDGVGPPPEREAALRARLGEPVPLTRELDGDAVLELGGRRAELLHAPGHSAGNLVAWLPAERVAIVGDAVMGRGVPLADGRLLYAPMYTPPAGYRSTVARLAGLEPQLLLAAHEPPHEGAGAAAFLRESARGADRVEAIVRAALGPQPRTLAELCREAADAWGGLPPAADEAFSMTVAGVLDELCACGEARLVASGPRRWQAAA